MSSKFTVCSHSHFRRDQVSMDSRKYLLMCLVCGEKIGHECNPNTHKSTICENLIGKTPPPPPPLPITPVKSQRTSIKPNVRQEYTYIEELREVLK